METGSRRRIGPRLWRWFDRALTVALLGFSMLLLASDVGDWRWGVLMGAQVVPLWWRRDHPTAVLMTVVGAHAVQALTLSDLVLPSQIAFPIAVYSAARWSPGWVKVFAAVISVIAAAVAAWGWTHSYATSFFSYVGPAISCAGIALTGWALGFAGAQRDRTIAVLVERADNLQRMAERDVALAAQDERARIAREMHDVVAHGLSVIVVQADGARYAATKDPHVAVGALETIAETGRGSLAEMRRLLGLLRTGDSGTTPQPRLADIAHLVAEAEASGMRITADLPEAWPPVSDGVGLAVYRVVQESLTNVRKHAGPHVSVELALSTEQRPVPALVATVRDDGRGASATGDGAGMGLRGMKERALVHDGELSAGPLAGGGWQVSARIPL